MKKYRIATAKKLQISLLLSILACLNPLTVLCQDYATLTGKLADTITNDPLPYAAVALYSTGDNKLISGQISDTNGIFLFKRLQEGKCVLKISTMGYEQILKEIDISNGMHYDEGIIAMKRNTVNLEETVITAERPKGIAENNKTTYFITRKMADASNNGLDIVRLIPGVRLDIHRNISLEGSRNILIMVDGKERDNNFLCQIDPAQIDRVEILSAPPSNFDGDITGAINIILKKEKKTGVNGQINSEIPVSGCQFYLHPDYNFSITHKKLTVFTSYNGEMIRFDQREGVHRRITTDENILESRTDQYVQQKLWSHRFHYGFDYDLTARTQINFYAFFNPYSQEYDGNARAFSNINENFSWEAERSSSDLNYSALYSMHFKHTFDERGHELNFDVSNYNLKGDNIAKYEPVHSDLFSSFENRTGPVMNAFSIKVDGTLPVGRTIKMRLGARARINEMEDRNVADFMYTGKVFSSYVSLSHGRNKYDLDLGIRLEKSISELKHSFRKPLISLLPSASFSYKISSDKTLKLALGKTIYRPNLYQLNPNLTADDPITIRAGNPALDPEIRTSLFLEYARKFKSNFYSVRLFYNRNHDCIHNLTFLNDTSVFETRVYNLGTIHELGFQIAGTLKLGELITFIPYLRFYGLNTVVNHVSEDFSIQNRKQAVVEPGFSSVLAFKHDFNLSMNLQYGSPKNTLQGNSFSDPLFFVALEKTFKRKFKAGITSVIPFKKPFTYQGSEIRSRDFYSCYSGDIYFSNVLVWFKLSYRFSSGIKHEKSVRSQDDIDILPKRGF